MEARSVGGGRFGIDDGLTERCGNAIAPADDAYADAFVDAVRGFGQQVFVEDSQDPADFGGWAFPVGGGQCKESERVNAEMRGRFDDCARGPGAGSMAGGTWQASGCGPAAVAVGNDGDVDWARWLGVALQVEMRHWDLLLSQDG